MATNTQSAPARVILNDWEYLGLCHDRYNKVHTGWLKEAIAEAQSQIGDSKLWLMEFPMSGIMGQGPLGLRP